MQKHLVTMCIVAIGFSIAACTEVSFPTHQPKGESILTEFPLELRGKYLPTDADSTRDTVVIDRNSYHIVSLDVPTDNDWMIQATLSDSLVLKKYKGYYFLNFKENDQWLLRVLKRNSNGDLNFRMFGFDGRKDKLLNSLQKEISVKIIRVDSSSTYYQIDPLPKKLLKLMKSKKYWYETELKRIQ